MLEIINYVFSSFWVWSGTAVLLIIVTHGVAVAIESLRGK